jgi:putative peptide zinc metalloprotease protein
MSVDSLMSPYWYRVASLHPRMRPHVSVQMQTTRGKAWYVLYNQSTGRHHRVNAQAYELVGRMDGRLTVDQVWQVLIEQLGDEAPSQHDVIRILGQMTEAGLIQAEVLPDVRELLKAETKRQTTEQRARLNPLSFRLGLFNPSRLLEWLSPLGRITWSRTAQVGWVALLVAALWALVVNWAQVQGYGRLYMFSPGYLAAAWVIYPVMKAMHEAAHALALRRYGCEVPEVGVNFFAFVPMPYVDASASNRLVNRWLRFRVSVAGIWVEMTLAAMAMLGWLVVEDGMVRQALFVVMSLGGLSTLLFNGNPLMRLDGYYAMCDALDLPNLAGRSTRVQGRWWRRMAAFVLGLKPDQDDLSSLGVDRLERLALAVYAPLSWAYRVGVTWLIVAWLAEKAAWLGAAVLAWALWSLVISPLYQWSASLTTRQDFGLVRWRAGLVCTAGALLLGTFVVTVPVASSVVVEGMVWLPENAQVRAPHDGEINAVLSQPDTMVEVGDPLVALMAPSMDSERQVLVAQLERSESEYHAAMGQDALKMQNAQEALQRDQAALKALDERLAKHVMRAGVAGRFVLPHSADVEGHQVNRGQLLAYVMSEDVAVIRALVPQRDIDAVRHRRQSVSVILDERPGQPMQARWLREVPAAADRLPDQAMADRTGGRVPTDPQDKEGMRPQEPSYVIDLVLPEHLPRSGGLAKVRIELAPQTLWDHTAQRARQLLLRHFSDLKD